MKLKLLTTGLLSLIIIGTLIYTLRPPEDHAFEKLLSKNKDLLKRAENFNQNSALRSLGKNRYNGFYFRFDEEIHTATADTEISLNKHSKYLLNYDFNWNRVLPSQDTGKTAAIIQNGFLSFKKTSAVSLLFNVNIKKDEVGKVEVRAKHKKGKYIYLGWNSKKARTEERAIQIDVVPDGKFHIYTVDVKNILRTGRLNSGDEIRTIFLYPSDVAGDEVIIDYIRFLSKKQQYNKSLYGVTSETKNKELRNVIFSHIPVALKYIISIPKERTVLSFGLGVLENSSVKFEVTINDIKVFHKTVSQSNKWYEHEIKMDKYEGKDVDITFSTSGETNNIAFWSNPIIYGTPDEKFNIILIIEDALRADHMSCYGHDRNTTPVKDELIKEGVLFKNAFSQATKTRPSCPSILTSLYPTATGVWNYYERLSYEYLTLVEILRTQGFLTSAFIQNSNSGPIAGLHQGYSHLFDDFGKKSEDMYSKRVVNWIEKNKDRNFFLYLHILDPHGPYNPPKGYRNWHMEIKGNTQKLPNRNLFDPEWVDNPTLEGRRALYDGEIKNNDYHFRIFLNKLKELNIFENTLLVFISDHGEHLGEHNEWGHHPPGYIQVIKTPMIFVYPRKLPKNISVNEPVQNLDVMPTILELAKIKKDKLLLQGDSLLSLTKGDNLEFWKSRVIISEEVVDKDKDNDSPWASIIVGSEHILSSKDLSIKRFNYIEDCEEVCSQELDKARARYYKTFIKKFQGSNMKIWKNITKGKDKKINWDPEVVKQLKSLGYISD